MDQKIVEKIENFIIKTFEELNVPGLSVGIIEEGKPVYKKGFGKRILEEKLPMNEDSLFGIGSISKSITALAIMQLVEQGKINLNDPVEKYMNFQLGFDESPITIHHLLSHSSGIAELDGANYPLDVVTGSTKVKIPMDTKEDFLNHLNAAGNEVQFKPEKMFFYNNDGYTCLSIIVENISGLKFDEYIKRNIFKPLKMERTTYEEEFLEKDPENNSICCYLQSEDTKTVEKVPFPYSINLYGPGGIKSSISELQNYMIALLNDGIFEGKEVIKKSIIEKLWTPNIKNSFWADNTNYCYAWVKEEDFCGNTVISHGGSVCVSTANFLMVPKKKIGVIIGANTGGFIAGILGRGILAILLGDKPESVLTGLFIEKKINKIIGNYVTYKGINRFKVELKGLVLYGTIMIDAGTDTFPLIAKNLDDYKFYIATVIPRPDAEIQFHINKKTGKVTLTYERYLFHKTE
ncbi:MAG: serine hydrolase [archaeon]|nr:serine hydrolase [archaeon]